MADEIGYERLNGERPALSGWPMVIFWAAMLIFACHACTHMVGAGDTWVAMACGRHFVNHGVDTVEPFSANSHKAGPTPETMSAYAEKLRNDAMYEKGMKKSLMNWWAGKAENFGNWPKWQQDFAKWIHPTGWINQNWLTHVIFYTLVPKSTYTPSDAFSSNALVYWKFAIYIVTIICVFYIAKFLKVNPALAASFACFALFTGRSYFDIRPAGFSNLLVGVFILVLVLATYRNILYIWLIVPLIVLWSNLHGGYIYAFIILVPFVGMHFLSALPYGIAVILYNIIAWPLYIYLCTKTPWNLRSADEKNGLVILFFIAAFLNLILLIFKNKMLSIGRKGIYHTIAAGFIAFIGMILFNPFHLTNLTHTFVISVSKHAEMWRSVNEWHPAFEWGNPVGTSYPFLILFALFIGLMLFWIFSRLLTPKTLTGSKTQLDTQKVLFDKLLKVFGFSLTLFTLWVTLLSFSLIDCDFASLVVCFLFGGTILLSIFQNVYYVYLSIPLILLVMQITGLANPNTVNAGYSGRYIYPFIIVPCYVFMHIIGSVLSKKVEIKRYKVVPAVIAAIFSLINIIVLFDPFRFTVTSWPRFSSSITVFFKSLAQTMWERGSSITKLFTMGSLGNIWHPAFINNAQPSYEYYLPGLMIINVLAVIIWLAFPYFHKKVLPAEENIGHVSQTKSANYRLANIDLSLITVVFMTIYMAISSRRFIPIAAIAACPVLAMFVDRIARNLSSSMSFHKNRRFEVPMMSADIQKLLIVAAAVITAYLGTSWALKFKMVYLDPWPTDTKLTTVFMRMTASDAKPFYAMKFIKDNKLSGKMFNYWTEGGFIAWGEEPAPNTGQIPLKLFIDGRAQAAYEPKAYTLWMAIMTGGPDAEESMRWKTPIDYKEAGEWIDKRLKEMNVWVVLMPAEQFDEPLVRGLETHPDWRLIFYDNKQRIYADIKKPDTARLLKGVFDGSTAYPDDFFRNLMLSYLKIFSTNEKEREDGLDIAMETFKSGWPESLMQKIIAGSRGEIQSKVIEFCKNVFDDFEKNKREYSKQDGYHSKLVSMLYITDYLRVIAEREKGRKEADFYLSKYKSFLQERKELQDSKRW